MSINKFAVSVALAGILGASSALAETSGAFVGVQAGYGGHKFTLEHSGGSIDINGLGSFRYGILAGYKQFFTPEFGLRYYGLLDYGTSNKKGKDSNLGADVQVSALNVNANVDALYNFISNESLDFGAFAGLSLGYARASVKTPDADNLEKDTPAGFDFGINFGLRTNIAQNHGIELYSRFGLLKHKKDRSGIDEEDGSPFTLTYKTSQPYAVGLRYSFSF